MMQRLLVTVTLRAEAADAAAELVRAGDDPDELLSQAARRSPVTIATWTAPLVRSAWIAGGGDTHGSRRRALSQRGWRRCS
jgi:hypothetical protein